LDNRAIQEEPVPRNTLSIDNVHDIPLSEVSGLGQRRAGASNEVLAVGDQRFDVIIAIVNGGGDWRFKKVSLASMLENARAEKSSEWEAADGDATGRVFMLQESPSRVYVIDRAFQQVEQRIDLNLDVSQRRELNWDADTNERAEGLVLLKNGHLLVAKEKEPPLLLEFGPGGDRAMGVRGDLLFDSLGEYPLGEEPHTTFELLTTWRLADDAVIADISDMAAGPDDHLYLLSDESRCIARIQANGSGGDSTISLAEVWELPEEMQQPEGLVILKDMVPVIAIDREEQEENLFVMEPLR
jgi:hypothetical protein